MARELERAVSEAKAGEWAKALASLLAVFQQTRNARVSALIGRVSEQAEKGLPAIAGKSLDAKKDAALALVKKGDPRDLPRVLRLIRELRQAQAVEIVEALEKVPADPRFLDGVLPLLRDPHLRSSSSLPFWRALIALVDAQGDPRTRPTLAALDFAWLPEWNAEQFRLICQRLAKKKLVATEKPLPNESLCAEIEAALGGGQKDGTALLAAIHANPDDDAARAVWADWLSERGDPRGEFVSLMLRADRAYPNEQESKAIKKLLDAHGEEWLGDLAGVLDLVDVRFRRGLLSHLHLATDELPRLVESEHAKTIEWLYLRERPEFDATLLKKLPALRFVGGVEPGMLDALEAAGPFEIPGLGVDLYDTIPGREDGWTEELRATLARFYGLRGTFPRVTTLAVRAWYKDAHHLDELWRSPLCEGVRVLQISGAGSDASWFARRDRLPQGLKQLDVTFDFGFHDWHTELHLEADGARMIATLRPKQQSFQGGKLEDLVEELDAFPTDALVSLEVRAEGTRVTKPALDAIAAAAGRHLKLRALTLPGRGTVAPKATPGAKTKKEQADEAFAAKTGDALGAVSALIGEKLDVALDSAQGLQRLKSLLDEKKSVDAGASLVVELAFAILELPAAEEMSGPTREAFDELSTAAFFLLAGAAPERCFERLKPCIEADWRRRLCFNRVFADTRALVRPGELPLFLDWFETLPVSQLGLFYYSVRDLLKERDSKELRADTRKRLEEHKLNRFHKWTYEDYWKRT